MPPSILLTIDVEDWFQVEDLKRFLKITPMVPAGNALGVLSR
jgi:hypothetical protein